MLGRSIMLHRAAVAAARAARAMSTAPAAFPALETLRVERPAQHVAHVILNRPDKSNAMNRQMWSDIGTVFRELGRTDDDSRVVLLTGAGRNFTSGLDMVDHAGAFMTPPGAPAEDVSRRAWRLRDLIKHYQASMTALADCPKPVIAAVHGACVGGGVDLICAADIRFASADAWFCVKEAEIGLAADVGTLQRMPKVLGNDSLVRELAFTARRMHADEASSRGFLSAVCKDAEELQRHALATAVRVASLSPIAVQGTKINLNQARDNTTGAGLEFAAAWNMAMLQTPDIPTAAEAMMTKKTPAYKPL